jgi:5-hydroxyisourate hydrolase-like protein (transthyretin family)
MKRKFLSIAILCIASILVYCSTNGNNISGTTDEINTGTKLSLADGSPAVNASVKIYAVTDELQKPVHQTTTDAKGHYTIPTLPAGDYNVWAKKDSLVAFQDSVYIGPDKNNVKSDTLFISHTFVACVKMQPNHTPTSVTVQVLGTDLLTTNVSENGYFTLNQLAKGTYKLRLVTTIPEYTPTYYSITITDKLVDTLTTPIQMIYTGIPVVTGLTATYDTLNGLIHLKWNSAKFHDLQDYIIYKDNPLTVDLSKIPAWSSVDTTFTDTIFKRSIATGPYSMSDTNSYNCLYRLAARNNSQVAGPTYKSVTIGAVSPTKVKPVFVNSIYHINKQRLTDSASVNDTLRLTTVVTSPTRTIESIAWTDLQTKKIIQGKSNLDTAKMIYDTLVYAWADTGVKQILISVVDKGNTTWNDTLMVYVVQDAPSLILRAQPLAVSINDTIRLHAVAADKFGKIIS